MELKLARWAGGRFFESEGWCGDLAVSPVEQQALG